MAKNNDMTLKERQAEEYKKEVADISTFVPCYIPTMCERIYELFGYETLDNILSAMCLTAQFYKDAEKCLQQLRGCFRMANMRYPLDLSVYEDTTSGRVLIITHSMASITKFLCDNEKKPLIKEDLELTPLK